jgi:type I restriction enzyme S subunit
VTNFCGIYPKYIYYLFNTINWELYNSGSGVPTLDRNDIHDLKCVIPSIEEQKRIAEVLSDVDCMISSLEKLIAKKKAVKQGAMQELLTGKKRLPGFVGEWEDYTIGKMGEFYSGLSGKSKKDFDCGEAHYITFLNVLSNVKIDTSILAAVDVKEGEMQNAVKKGDLFFNTSSETPEEVGMCAVLDEDLDNTYLNSFCFGFRLNDDTHTPLFLSYYLNSAIGRRIMSVLAQGATRYNLSKNNFAETVIQLPEKEEQNAIASILSNMDNEIEALEQKLAKTRQIKQGMMQQLLTGKIRLV